jgi:hypothetical protein
MLLLLGLWSADSVAMSAAWFVARSADAAVCFIAAAAMSAAMSADASPSDIIKLKMDAMEKIGYKLIELFRQMKV